MKKHIYSIIILVIITSCKVPQMVSKQTLQESPQSFLLEKPSQDSMHLGKLSWKDFFQDTELIKLIEISLQNNYDVQMALQNIQMAQAQVKYNKANLLPYISVGANAGIRRFGLYTMDGAGNATTDITPGQIVPTNLPDYFVGLQTSWEIDIWKKLRSKKQPAILRYFSSIEGKNVVITNLITELASLYYQLLRLENESHVIKEAIKLQELALEIIKLQKETGNSNELAVKQFEAQVYSAKSLENELLQAIVQTENQINQLLARYPQKLSLQKESLYKELSISPQTGIPSQTLRNRPDVRQAEFEYLASMADLKASRAEFFPSLMITGSLGFQAFNPKFLFSTPESIAYSLLGSFFAPILNRNGIKAQFEYTKAYQQQSFLNYQKTWLTAYVEVSTELQNLMNLQKTYQTKTQELVAHQRAVDISLDLFRASRATYLEVLLTQQNLLNANLELIALKKRQWDTQINLYKSLGGGWK
ncbi:MAG: TolC family protein [Thermonemataceae bacterium]|nr:TolC family protein [Thermonemataceae bacterium]